MDGNHFYALLRALTASPSRRGALRLLGRLGFAGLVGDAAAKSKKRKKHKKRKKKNKQVPPPPTPDSTPPPPPCVGSCTGKTCGDDGCGGSCGDCAGVSVCEGGQCVATCCAAGTFCFEDYCTCETSGSDFCSCPAGDAICHGAACCLAEDTCITPIDCLDGQRCACATQTCHAGNTACEREFALCGSGAPGSCGCFLRGDGSALCAVMPGPEESICPEFSECATDDECPEGDVCANVACCNLAVEPFVGRCVTPCP